MKKLIKESENYEINHSKNIPDEFKVCVETKDAVMDGDLYKSGFKILDNFLYINELKNVKIAVPLAKDFKEDIEIKSNTIFCAFDGAYNYSHWLLNILPRFSFIQNFIKNEDYLILTDPINDLQKEVYSHLGYDLSKFRELQNGMSISGEEIWITPRITSPDSHRSFPKWSLQFLNNIYLKEKKDTPKKFYISRKDSSRRFVFNEDEITPILKEKGFEIIVMSDFKTLKNQIDLFYNAEYILAPHGAALANLIFCKPKTKIVEILNKNYLNPMYYVLSEMNNLDYSFVYAKEIINGPSSQFNDILISKELALGF